MWRNRQYGGLRPHLFADDAVAAAGGDTEDDDMADAPVWSLCSATRSYGPFYRIAYDDAEADDNICRRCLARWTDRRAAEAAADDTDAETNGGVDTATAETEARQ